ncbi:MAG: GDP-L-fucose synthase, partial [Mucinivorans sp.]
MELGAKIYVAGHRGMVGSAIVRNLKARGYTNIVGRTSSELNLINQEAVTRFFETEQPEYVFLAAAKVGGIVANSLYRAQFLYENLMIQCNVIQASYLSGVKKLMFLGSSCIYPRLAHQPIQEDELLTGLLEPTNEPYAIAKIAGLKMCEAYRAQYGCNYVSVMPTNLYGPGDNYNLETSHVLPALIRKMHLGRLLQNGDKEGVRKDLNRRPICGVDGQALWGYIEAVLSKFGITDHQIELWGTGSVLREFLHVDDMADATVYVMENYNEAGHVNVGSSEELTIHQIAQ